MCNTGAGNPNHLLAGRQPPRDEANAVRSRHEIQPSHSNLALTTGARPPHYQHPHRTITAVDSVACPWHQLILARAKAAPGVTTGIGPQHSVGRQHAFDRATVISAVHFKSMAPPRFTCPLCGVVDSCGRRRCDHCRCARCFMALPCAGGGSKRRCDDASRRDDVRSTAPAVVAPHTPLRPPREKRAAAAVCDALEAPARRADDAKPETPARPRRRRAAVPARPKTAARRSRRIAAAKKKAVAPMASKAPTAVGT